MEKQLDEYRELLEAIEKETGYFSSERGFYSIGHAETLDDYLTHLYELRFKNDSNFDHKMNCAMNYLRPEPEFFKSINSDTTFTHKKNNLQHNLLFEIIRIRSQIAKALIGQIPQNKKNTELYIALRTFDVIEHIAQDVLNTEHHTDFLITSLDTAKKLINDYGSTLRESNHNVPSEELINELIQKLEERV